MGSSLRKFTSRTLFFKLLIHASLAAALYVWVLPIIENGYKTRFIDQVGLSASHIATIVANQGYVPPALIDQTHVVSAQLTPTDNPQYSSEYQLGKGGDQVFKVSVPLELENQGFQLELGFNEAAVWKTVEEIRLLGITIIAGYFIIAVLITLVMNSFLNRPIVRLRKAARAIAEGKHVEHFDAQTKITEIALLSKDLERMRSKLVAQREDLAIREARISAVMDNVADALITIDEMGNIQSFNLAAERIFGYSTDEIIEQSVNLLFAAPLVAVGNSDKDDGTPFTIEKLAPYETLGRRRDGSTFHMEASISEICEMAGCLSIVVCRDISERKHAEIEIKSLKEDLEQRVVKRTRELATVNKELQHQALHDALTGLPNRVLMQDRLEQATRAAKREGHALALMITDLDRFKEINDTLGHHYGDLLLQQVAVRMRGALRDSDTVARLGGDEFAVLLPSIKNDDQAAQAAIKIASAMEAPFILENQHFHVGISIGIAMYPNDGENSNHLMRRADVAMYVAKRAQTDYAFYNPEQDQHSASRLALVSELRAALDKHHLSVCYQPTVDLKTKKIVGVESLIRWEHPEKGTIFPSDFINLAEQTGLIKTLTTFVLEESLAQLERWRSVGIDLRMSINLSARNLHDPEFSNQIIDLISRRHLKSDSLQLEITESAIMEDPMRAMTMLSKLNEMGIKLSIDDFGTGYSSLAYLKQLPVKEIKIDRSFVNDMTEKSEDRVIVRSTIDLAHNMGHRVIAEGVDTQKTLEMLEEMSCDLAQGYFICRPAPAGDIYQWIMRNRKWRPNIVTTNAKKRGDDNSMAAG